jgi:hypothetical protein
MSNPFFERPILNSPYEYPVRHWELDADGQPTQRIIENRRLAEFKTLAGLSLFRRPAVRQTTCWPMFPTISEKTILRFHKLSRANIGDAGKYKEKDSDIIEKLPDGRVRVRF